MHDSSSTTAAIPEYLSREQAAQLINMSPAWIRKQERLGAGPKRVRAGKCIRYTRDSLHAFMASRVEGVVNEL